MKNQYKGDGNRIRALKSGEQRFVQRRHKDHYAEPRSYPKEHRFSNGI